MAVFIKHGHFCIVPIDGAEVREKYIHRGYFIVSQLPQNQDDFDKYERLSRYENNIKFLNCVYSTNITKECKDLEKNMFSAT